MNIIVTIAAFAAVTNAQDPRRQLAKDTYRAGDIFGACLRPWGAKVACEPTGKVMSYAASEAYAKERKSKLPTIDEMEAFIKAKQDEFAADWDPAVKKPLQEED